MSRPEKAELLRALHRDEAPLILPNAWDASSARVLVDAGFTAIATASHAVSASLGYQDGEGAPADEMFAAAARITGAVEVPVSVDVESGYGLPPAELAERLRDAGACGCNIEDTLHPGRDRSGDGTRGRDRTLADVKEQAERIEALRAADRDLVINARVDVFERYALPGAGTAQRLEEAVLRSRAYLEAGADCVFPTMVTDEAVIGALVRRVPGPVNVLYRPGVPSPARLGELGVARVTFGPGLQRATLRLLGELAQTLRSGHAPY